MATPSISVKVNGQTTELPAGTYVSGLLALLSSTPGKVAVEVNRAIVPRSVHGSYVLSDGDAVEIVSFVGGG